MAKQETMNTLLDALDALTAQRDALTSEVARAGASRLGTRWMADRVDALDSIGDRIRDVNEQLDAIEQD